MGTSAQKNRRSRTTGRYHDARRGGVRGTPFFSTRDPFFRTSTSDPVQPKLTVNAPDDKYEREADRVAAAVMRTPNSQVQRLPEEEEERYQIKPAIQRKEAGDTYASPALTRQINSSKGQGNTLSPGLEQKMSQKMGADFSDVKIHTDSKASNMSNELGARAFTVGSNIYFRSGQYKPGTTTGKWLLAHELTHVLQQSVGRKRKHDGQGGKSNKPVDPQSIQRAPWYKFWIDERHSQPGSTLTAINVDPDSTLDFDTGWHRSDIGSALLAVATGLAVNRVSKVLKLTKSVAEGVGLLVGGLTAYEGYQVEQRVWGETVSFHEWYGRYQVNVFTGDLIAVDFQGTGEEQRTIAIPYFFQERVADTDGNPVYNHTRHEFTVPGIEVSEPEFPERSFGTFE